MMILQRLREQTQSNHKRLETRLDLLDTMLSRERYERLVSSFYGFYVPVEERLGKLCPNLPIALQFEERRKVPLLLQDLAAFGRTEQQIEALPLCRELPVLDLLSQALGCLYVLEGSTLGGQIISRHLNRIHGIHENNGGAFFSSYRSRIGAMWRSFGICLTDYATEKTEEEAVIIGATCETFARLESWLCDE